MSTARMAPPPPPSPTAAPQQSVAGMFTLDGADDAAQQAIRMRENFNALAVFAPSVPTDAAGRAEVKVKVPDNLTRYRVMAVAVAGGKQFGSGESAITARQPVMVRPSAPRFLNFGDRFELPVVVQNQTDSPAVVDVAVRAVNAEFTDGAGTPRHRARERPRRGALPRFGLFGRDGALSGRRALGPLRRRGAARASRLHARDDRGVRNLRRDRPERRRRPAGQGPAGRLQAVRRARSPDLLDAVAGAHRRRALPRRVPLRVLRAVVFARARRRRAARRADGLQGQRPAEPRGDEGGRRARHQAARRLAEPGRRLRLLASRRFFVALRQHPRRARARAREGEGLRRAAAHARQVEVVPARDRVAHPAPLRPRRA